MLRGWYLLPPGYKPVQRLPVVVWVYPGTVFSDTPPNWFVHINEAHSLNLQLLAAHGYLVLMPSMPLPSSDTKNDPYMELGKGVLPAIDQLVNMGLPYRRVA